MSTSSSSRANDTRLECSASSAPSLTTTPGGSSTASTPLISSADATSASSRTSSTFRTRGLRTEDSGQRNMTGGASTASRRRTRGSGSNSDGCSLSDRSSSGSSSRSAAELLSIQHASAAGIGGDGGDLFEGEITHSLTSTHLSLSHFHAAVSLSLSFSLLHTHTWQSFSVPFPDLSTRSADCFASTDLSFLFSSNPCAAPRVTIQPVSK
jgi:hypothetical protein